jgi:hypothetical protein
VSKDRVYGAARTRTARDTHKKFLPCLTIRSTQIDAEPISMNESRGQRTAAAIHRFLGSSSGKPAPFSLFGYETAQVHELLFTNTRLDPQRTWRGMTSHLLRTSRSDADQEELLAEDAPGQRQFQVRAQKGDRVTRS